MRREKWEGNGSIDYLLFIIDSAPPEADFRCAPILAENVPKQAFDELRQGFGGGHAGFR